MSAIPYTIERRPDTGVNNVQLGIWLFLASEVMLFGGLFSAYFMLRAGAPAAWQPMASHFGAGVATTVLLFGGTACFAGAQRTARTGRLPAFRVWMSLAVLLSLLFLGDKALQYAELAAANVLPSTSTQWATYYLLTGVHALHVAGGVIVNVWLLCTGSSRWSRHAPAIRNRLGATALYWYFVDAVWVLLFLLLYVV
jgi:heme/copper-type cytochrome/quinol oxidase subunit 3